MTDVLPEYNTWEKGTDIPSGTTSMQFRGADVDVPSDAARVATRWLDGGILKGTFFNSDKQDIAAFLVHPDGFVTEIL
jgi:hypothetical protein